MENLVRQALMDLVVDSETITSALDLFYSKLQREKKMRPLYSRLQKRHNGTPVTSLIICTLGTSMQHKFPDCFKRSFPIKLTKSNYHQVIRHLISSLREAHLEQQLLHEVMLRALSARTQLLE